MPTHNWRAIPIVYAITHVASGRQYVGSTTLKASVRFNGHLSLLRRGVHTNRYLQAAWAKYGAEAFRCEVIEEVPDSGKLIAREQAHLDARLPHVFNLGLTVERAALGVVRSAEFRAKIAAAHRGKKRPPHLGAMTRARQLGRPVNEAQRAALKAHREQPKSPEHRRKIAVGNTGKVMSEASRRKISASKKGRPGHRMSPENKAKLRAANCGRPLSAEHRAKISAASTGHKKWLGRRHTLESRAKMSAARQGKVMPPWSAERRATFKRQQEAHAAI